MKDEYQKCQKCRCDLIGLHKYNNDGKLAQQDRRYCYDCEQAKKESESV